VTVVHFYSCSKCKVPLDIGLGRIENGTLIVDCPRCKSPVKLEGGLKCQDCGATATRFEVRGIAHVTLLYYCDRHLDAHLESSRARRRKAWAFYGPIAGTALIVISFLDRSNPGKPFLPLIAAGILCWATAMRLWIKPRPSSASDSPERDE
jgi:hypothetical protein